MLHITPWILMLMLHIRQSIYLVLTNVLIYLISDVPHYIRSNQHNTACTILVKVDVYTRYMWSNNMFVLWNRISAIFYEDRKYCLHIFPWFLTSWTFRITSLLNLNEYQCYHHLDLSMIEGFHGFVMFSLSLSKIGWILFSNAKETLQKMLARKCSYRYRGKHMKDWKQVLIIKSLKLPNFFFDIRLSMYWQNAFAKILSKTGFVDKDL